MDVVPSDFRVLWSAYPPA